MKKTFRIHSGGRNERSGGLLINRLLPNEQTMKIGPFVFLGHVYPAIEPLQAPGSYPGQHVHPHRGIVTLSYLLSGSLQYIDSFDNQGVANSGDVLWLKAGNGVVHEETPICDSRSEVFHVLQFWINLPAIHKTEDPEYRLLRAGDIPELELPDEAGKLKVILGGCGVAESPLDTYLEEFIFHVRLNPKSAFSITLKHHHELAVFIPDKEVHVNGRATCNSYLLGLPDDHDGPQKNGPPEDGPQIHLYNPAVVGADAFIFGGCEYCEPIVAEGPFVMNSRMDIARAYGDFFAGRYGQLKDRSINHL